MRLQRLWALSVLLLVSCVPTKAEVQKGEVDTRVPVEVMTVQVGDLAHRGDYYGFVEPRVSVTVQAEVSGQVVALPVEEGDQVEKGQLLLSLDDEPFRLAEEQAVQALEAARVRVSQAEKNIEIQRKTLTANVDQAKAALARAQATLDLVERGARSEEKKQVKAGVDAATVQFDSAQVEFDRVTELYKANAATRQQLDGARTALDGARAGLDQATQTYRLIRKGARQEDKDAARAGVAQAEAGVAAAEAALASIELQEEELKAAQVQVRVSEINLENVRLSRSKAKISSPVEGQAVVSSRGIDLGEMVMPGKPLLELIAMRHPRIVMKVPARDIASLSLGKKVQVFCIGDKAALGREAVVSYIPMDADPQNTTFDVKLTVDNEDLTLRSGQVCEAYPDLVLYKLPLVPRDAVLDTMEGKAVMLVDAEGTVREQAVELATVRDGIAAVSKGLAGGEKIVVVGERIAADGDKANVKAEHPSVAADDAAKGN